MNERLSLQTESGNTNVENGDLEKLEEQIAELRPKILRVCQKMLGRKEQRLAEDLAHEAIIRGVQNVHQFRGDAKLESWLTRIAINVVLDYFRRIKSDPLEKQKGAFIGEGGEEIEMQIPDLAEGPSQESIFMAKEGLEKALEKLPKKDLDVIILLLLENTEREIADSLNISIPAAKSRIHRARERLKRLLDSSN